MITYQFETGFFLAPLNPNMPVRLLNYVAELFKIYLEPNRCYCQVVITVANGCELAIYSSIRSHFLRYITITIFSDTHWGSCLLPCETSG